MAMDEDDDAAMAMDEDDDAAMAMDDDMDARASSDTGAESGPQTYEVLLPEGTSVVGCERTDECYVPAELTVGVGDTVSWVNVDSAAHTVTSGTIEQGPDGRFDSSLLMSDRTYSFTFDASGDYDYYCIVHPWMVGKVIVP